MGSKNVSSIVEEVAGSYDYREPPDLLVKLQELISSILRIIQDFLNSLSIQVPGMGDTSSVGNLLQLVMFLVGIVCTCLVIRALWKRMRNQKKQRQLSSRGASAIELELDSKGWQAEAQRLASIHEWREALRALYFSFLRKLDEVEIIRFSPMRTNYEYWYALARNKQMQQDFRNLADTVEDSWFGWHEPGKEDFERSLKTLNDLDLLVAKEVASRVPETGGTQ